MMSIVPYRKIEIETLHSPEEVIEIISKRLSDFTPDEKYVAQDHKKYFGSVDQRAKTFIIQRLWAGRKFNGQARRNIIGRRFAFIGKGKILSGDSKNTIVVTFAPAFYVVLFYILLFLIPFLAFLFDQREPLKSFFVLFLVVSINLCWKSWKFHQFLEEDIKFLEKLF